MSTANSSGRGAKKPPDGQGQSPPSRKNKSKGFIESAEFKPNWLETGPLSPDMLPDPQTVDSESLTDEFVALQAALQRYYGAEPAEVDTTPPEEAESPTEATPAKVLAAEPEAPPLVDLDAAAVELNTSPPEKSETASGAVPVEVVAAEPEAPPLVDLDADAAEAVSALPAAEPPAPPGESPTVILPELPSESQLDNPPVTSQIVAGGAPAEAEPHAPSEPRQANPPEWLAALLVEAAPMASQPSSSLAPPRPPAPPETLAFIESEPPPVTEVEPTLEAESSVTAPIVSDNDTLPAAPAATEALIPDTPLPVAVEFAVASSESGVEVTSPADAEPTYAERALEGTTPAPVAIPTSKPARPRRARRAARPSRLARALLAISLLLLAAAAVIFYLNPFMRLALGTATLARPAASSQVFPPRDASGDWCLAGDFLGDSPAPRLVDDGTQGDVLAEDNVFSLQHTLAEPGSHTWQVVDCANSTVVYPPQPAWVATDEPGQPVTFIFDPTERADRLFFPISYVVSALDSADAYRVVGDFQDWNPADPTSAMQRLNSGLYQQVRRIARSGEYQGYVIAADGEQAIDAYGRATEPIPFAFETIANGEIVVFLLDIDRGRSSVLYHMPTLLTRLAFDNGYIWVSAALLGLALFLLALLLVRALILRNRRLWIDAGCPRCHEHELMRIARHSGDRWLHVLGIPAYRYRCRACVWEGRRLSATGESISPGVSITYVPPLD